mgnify:CR=1 FL=1
MIRSSARRTMRVALSQVRALAARVAALRPRPGGVPADPATLAGWAPYVAAREAVLALA